MGLINFFNRSFKKTKIMKKLINCISFPVDATNFSEYPDKEESKIVKKVFYNFISEDYLLGPILEKHKVTYEVFEKIFERYLALGYNYWEGTNHIPVSLFSFSSPLDYIMSNKEVFEKEDNYNEVVKICYNSKQFLGK